MTQKGKEFIQRNIAKLEKGIGDSSDSEKGQWNKLPKTQEMDQMIEGTNQDIGTKEVNEIWETAEKK